MTALTQLIVEKIVREGSMPFVDFMAQCLYHPVHGYYMTERQRIGRAGDFFTSSSVHALFGTLVARQIEEMWRLLGTDEFVLVEQGGGEGHLALDILNAFRREFPHRYTRLTYRMLEASPVHQRRQRQLLQEHLPLLEWFDPDGAPPYVGCLVSNELLDAMPVHLVEMIQGGLSEIYVGVKEGRLCEELVPLSPGEIISYFEWLGVFPAEGCRAEVNLAAMRWLESAATQLQRGFVMTIDYGYPTTELYAPWRRSGTLMCYQRHTTSDNPYDNCGEQDMTAHIDFAALQRRGNELGLTEIYFGEQYRFLMGLGFVEELLALQAQEVDPRRAQQLCMTLKHLILPEGGGMGETFKVLVQGKGVDTPDLKCARSMKDIASLVGNAIY